MGSGVIGHNGVSSFAIDVKSEKIPDSKAALDHANVQDVTAADLNVADLGVGRRFT